MSQPNKRDIARLGLVIGQIKQIEEARRQRWLQEGEIPRETDCLLEGSGFELSVPRCALIANSAALVAPPDSVVRGGSLNGHLTTPIGGRPATPRLTRREDRSALGKCSFEIAVLLDGHLR